LIKWIKLSDLCKKITDGSHFSPHSASTGFPMMSVKDMRDNGFSYSDCKYINKSDFDSIVKADCKPLLNDILIAKDGSYLKHVFVIENEKDEVILSSIGILRPNLELLNPYYIKYYLHSDFVKKQVAKKFVSGSALPRIIIKNFGNIEVPYVEKKDQGRIVNVLKSIDTKIQLNNRINTELESMAKTLYDYWFVQFDFPDKNGKPYKSSGGKMLWNEELKREIPEGWKNGIFGNYANLKGGFAFKSNWWIEKGLPVIKIKDINEDNTLSIENCSCVNQDKYDKAKNYEAFPGDVVIAMTGATVGKFGIVPKTNNSILVNQRVGLFNLGKNPILKLPFLINSLNQDYFRDTIFIIASGAAQPNISSDQIDAIPLVIPDKKIIDLFNSKLSCFYEITINNIRENQKLSELRDWLLPMLMNGQVRVG